MIEQQDAQEQLAEHAAADERRRIAREVHDVIAHSLSITLLHITAARRGLQEDRDVDEAVDALRKPSDSAVRRWPTSGAPSVCSTSAPMKTAPSRVR